MKEKPKQGAERGELGEGKKGQALGRGGKGWSGLSKKGAKKTLTAEENREAE